MPQLRSEDGRIKEVGQAMIQNRLNDHLIRANISQTTLAHMVGTYQPVVSGVCNGTRIFDYPLFLRVCKVIGCVPRDIYDDDTIRVIYPEVDRL